MVSAQILRITPSLIDSSEPVEEALSGNKGRASTSIQGKGAFLQITYTSSEPIFVYMVPVSEDGKFVPTDFLSFTLSEAQNETVEIDLTVSPGWSPQEKKWILHLLTKTEEAKAGFTSLTIIPASLRETASAGIRHVFTQEPYTPSSYHALRGYRVFGVQVTVILGFLAVLTGLGVLVFSKQKFFFLVIVLLGFHFVYAARFSIDLARYTKEHLIGYKEENYDEAGSVHIVAKVLKEVFAPVRSVYVCRDGTNYKEKLLRYFAYPIPVSAESGAAAKADFALVMGKSRSDWSVRTETVNQQTRQILKCNDFEKPVELLTTFPDGTSLFRLLP